MGTVYRATQISLGREVAVKLVPTVDVDESVIARFKREVRTAAALEHPNSIPIYGAGEEEGLLYLVMRLVLGPDLGAIIAAEGALAPGRAVGLVEQIAGALDAAHGAGLVHRDVKPGNVLVEPSASGEHAYLSDFGLMRRVSGATAITRVGEWVGTVDYVAPEQVRGRPVDLRADVYALAALLYASLVGHPPFPAENPTDTARAHLTAPPPVLPGGAEMAGLNAVIARGMAKRPEERFASAGELARAARGALDRPGASGPARSVPASFAPAPRPEPAPRSPAVVRPAGTGRRVTRGVLVIIVVAGAAGGLAAVLTGRSQSSHTASVARSATAAGPQLYAGPAGSFRYPRGWGVVEAERPEGGGAYFRTAVVSPNGTEMVDVDRTPHDPLTPGQRAASVEAATAARTPGYTRVSFSSSTLAGRPAVVWQFTLNGEPHPARIDIFQKLGTTGYAVYGRADTVHAAAAVALAVAQSLTAR
jgi:hypothetical protein